MTTADEANIATTLTLIEVAAVSKTFNRQPPSEVPPDGLWNVLTKISAALDANQGEAGHHGCNGER